MIAYKFDVLEKLKENGYTTHSLRKEKLLPESAIQALRSGKMIGIKTLNELCRLLNMQPADIIKYIED